MNADRWLALVNDLRALPSETGWVEFKHGNHDPDRLARSVSALANSACLQGEPFGYMVWGIEDGSHAVVGSQFEPSTLRCGNEPLEFWLAKSLDPSPSLVFRTVTHPSGRLVLLQIPATTHAPVKFRRIAYIRIGEATPPLSDYPEREQTLWAKIQSVTWEHAIAKQFVSGDEILDLLDYAVYFSLTGQRLPDNRAGILDELASDHPKRCRWPLEYIESRRNFVCEAA